MRSIFRFWGILTIVSFVFITVSCGDNATNDDPDSSTAPVLTTAAVSAITQTTAQCGGDITSDGGATVTARGVCWSINQTPTVADNKTTDGTGSGSFISSITGLTAGTTYYVRAYATNSVGTGYGSAMTCNTLDVNTVVDIDGNVYQTVVIGTQEWMAENLRVTHYRNGNEISNVTDSATWKFLVTGAYCDYNNEVANVVTYGRLYNWYAVDDSRDLAPVGWHVPTQAEWQTLIDFLGGSAVAGGKLKEIGTSHWASPNTDATDLNEFTALPGGFRRYQGGFDEILFSAYHWSSTEYDGNDAWYCYLEYNTADAILEYSKDKPYGFSIRCVKD